MAKKKKVEKVVEKIEHGKTPPQWVYVSLEEVGLGRLRNVHPSARTEEDIIELEKAKSFIIKKYKEEMSIQIDGVGLY